MPDGSSPPRAPRAPTGPPAPPPRDPSARTLRDAGALVAAGLLAPAGRAGADAVAARYAVAVTPAVAVRIDPADPADPVARQYLPHPDELRTLPGELADPTADAPHSPVPGVVHRYPDRALLKPLLACPVYCRFCFRREHVGPGGGVLDDAALGRALAWFAAAPSVREAILTGGDPLILSPRRLGRILGALDAVPHLEILRVHSRVPVADPGRVTGALLAALRTEKPLYLCVHANHAAEFGPQQAAALRALAGAGVVLLGQSVLLRGVNDGVDALEALFRTMLRHRIKPYYLHQLDRAPGTARFEVPIAEGRALLAALRGRVTGLAWPTYVLDLPGGLGKAPLGPDFAARDGAGWAVAGPLGGHHRHPDGAD